MIAFFSKDCKESSFKETQQNATKKKIRKREEKESYLTIKTRTKPKRITTKGIACESAALLKNFVTKSSDSSFNDFEISTIVVETELNADVC